VKVKDTVFCAARLCYMIEITDVLEQPAAYILRAAKSTSVF